MRTLQQDGERAFLPAFLPVCEAQGKSGLERLFSTRSSSASQERLATLPLAFAISILWITLSIQAAHGQDGVLNKMTVSGTADEFGGIEEVVVVNEDGGIQTVELQQPLGVSAALKEAEDQLGADFPDGSVICFELLREEIEKRSDVHIQTAPGTIVVGDPENDPCNVIVVTGGVTITITETAARIFFYRVQVHVGVRDSCALRLTAFSFDTQTSEITLAWESIPESQYTIEVSSDMKEWEDLKRDIPSQGTSTTETLATGNADARELYFRVRLQIDSLPDPVP